MTKKAPHTKTLIVFFAFALAVVMALPLTSASSGRRTSRESRELRSDRSVERSMERLSIRLDLDESQIEAVQLLMEDHHQSMKETDKELNEARKNLKDQVRAESFDEKSIRSVAELVGHLEADRAVSKGKMLEDLRGVLTGDQYQEFIDMEAHRGRRMERHRSRGQGMREGREERYRERELRKERRLRPSEDLDEEDSDL